MTPFTPAHQAVELDDFETLRRLLDAGADIQDPVNGGWTLLHHAVDGEIDVANQQNEPVHVDMTAFLLARGADPSPPPTPGRRRCRSRGSEAIGSPWN